MNSRQHNNATKTPRPMRANALLKLLMGSAGGLVLAVSGVQCQPTPANPLNQTPGVYRATDTDNPQVLGDMFVTNLTWDYIEDYPTA